MLNLEFDFKNPDYCAVFEQRQQQLLKIRQDPSLLAGLKRYYRDHPGQFITDWGVTIEPRNVERGLPSIIPFILFPRQEEWVEWTLTRWKNQESGLIEKSRDMGVSWLSVGLSVAICLFNEGAIVGFGSRKEEYVDKIGSPKAFFHRAREFISHLPREFIGEWCVKKHAPFTRITFPSTGSVIGGECGNDLGRGDRVSIFFVDEAASLPHPEITDAALSQTTNCRIDISTPRGTNNSFARKRFSGRVPVFSFHWREDPRKDEIWYKRKCDELNDPVLIAQELNLDYSAAVERVLIPSEWVQSAIDAHLKLKISVTGARVAGFDIADEGKDKNAFCGRYGLLIDYVESWSGKDSDIFKTVQKAILLCDLMQYEQIAYDADGIGAGVRGDARVAQTDRKSTVVFSPFRGSGEVINPGGCPFTGARIASRDASRTNKDFFANAKAQAWWSLRRRFQLTHRAVTEGILCDPDDVISISSRLQELNALTVELSQPTYSQNNVGKILIDKAPNGARSPNLADAVMIAFASLKKRARGFLDVP